jgi:hypothetical protein
MNSLARRRSPKERQVLASRNAAKPTLTCPIPNSPPKKQESAPQMWEVKHKLTDMEVENEHLRVKVAAMTIQKEVIEKI